MKLVRFNGGRVGVVRGDLVVDVTEAAGIDPQAFPPVGTVRLIAEFDRLGPQLAAVRGEGVPIADVTLETPIAWPQKVIALPGNFRAHREEMADAPPVLGARGFFLKSPSALSGAGEPIVLPEVPGREVHHESELGIVIGRRGRHVSREDALEYVFGYACALDITVRDMVVDRILRKSYDSFAPFGPWIVTADEVGDPSELGMRLWVGDELRQSANMRDLIVDIPGMIAMASSVMTLHPGDLIFSGTPAGVGPIVDGDTVTIEIERVGRMSVPVRQGHGGNNLAFQGLENSQH
ncbi:fumarylacetoacetate hydrolase family protein [Streptomyces sp. NBC_00075]|uniref:fumarylacetoacetate hydrolase family protein n=1 Tax=Streptomyces sp. NBC_00075 TaxID=2975641 RepID=UPI00324BC263